jgi:hypothetical protein
MEERRVIFRGQTEPRFVSGTVSRTFKGSNPSVHKCHRSESQAVGRGLLFLAARLVVTPKKDDDPLSLLFQKTDFFNTPQPILGYRGQSNTDTLGPSPLIHRNDLAPLTESIRRV